MAFPKYIKIYLKQNYILNVTKKGEVTESQSVDLPIIELVSKALKFSYKVYSPDFFDPADTNVTLIVGGITLTEGMYPISSYPYGTTDITFMVEKPKYELQTLAFMKSFTWNVWIGLLLSVFLISFLHFLLFRGKNSFTSALFYVTGTLAGEHKDWKPKSIAQKVLVLSWSFGTTFLILCYASVLLSVLTVHVKGKGINDFIDLYDAIRQDKITVFTFNGSTEGDRLIDSKDEKLKFIGEHVKANKMRSMQHYHEIVANRSNVAFVATRNLLETEYGDGRYLISQDSVHITFYVIAEAADCSCMEKIDTVIHTIWAAGLKRKINEDFNFKRRAMVNRYHYIPGEEQEQDRALNLSDFSETFHFLVTGYILGFVCLICEIFAARYCR